MRSTIHSFAVPVLLGSTLVYAVPHVHPDLALLDSVLRKRQTDDGWGDIVATTGTLVASTPHTNPTPSPNQVDSAQAGSTSYLENAAVAGTVTTTQLHDTLTDQATNTIHSTSGTIQNPSGSTGSPVAAAASSSGSLFPTSLAPSPTATESNGIQNRGVLIGVVVGGLIFGFLALTVGLWLCYRRRGPTSGASTPRYTTPVVGDEKPRSAFAFFRRGRNAPWKKSHLRVRSSMSFASPMIGDEPKMIETPSATSRAPLAPHLGGGGSTTRDTWNGRWSTFSTSDGSAYPQTPVGNHAQLSGVMMETVIESDAPPTPRAPSVALRPNSDYLNLHRSPNNDAIFTLPSMGKDQQPQLPPLGATRYSMYRGEEPGTPSTPTSSSALTFGSAGGVANPLRISDRTVVSQPFLSGLYSNGSNPSHPGLNGPALLATRPKFNPIHHNGSGSLSTRQGSTGSGSGGDAATIRITNPFLDDDEDLSSYGHGIVEASETDDARSMQSMESDAFGAYPSSAGCLPPKARLSPSPSPDSADAPINRPRSSLISDASSDYPYPMGYAMDADGNVANPFLRISELLEEVDGRMRWPSPPLLTRSESRNNY